MQRHNHVAGNHQAAGNHHAIGGHHHAASFHQTAHAPFHGHANLHHAHIQPHIPYHQPAIQPARQIFRPQTGFYSGPIDFFQPTRHHLLFSRYRYNQYIQPLIPYWDTLDYINETDILLFLTLNYMQQQAIINSIRLGQYYSFRAAIDAAQFNNTFNTFTVGAVHIPDAPYPVINSKTTMKVFDDLSSIEKLPELAEKIKTPTISIETIASKNPILKEVLSHSHPDINPIIFDKPWFNHKNHADAFFILYDKYAKHNKPQAAARMAMARLNNASAEDAAIIVRMNSDANDPHTQVMRILEPYIEENRLSGLNFRRGFTFFVDTQSTNREANYHTAVDIQLRASRGEDLRTLLSKPNVEFLRSKYPHTFGINSRTLNNALDEARCLVEQSNRSTLRI